MICDRPEIEGPQIGYIVYGPPIATRRQLPPGRMKQLSLLRLLVVDNDIDDNIECDCVAIIGLFSDGVCFSVKTPTLPYNTHFTVVVVKPRPTGRYETSRVLRYV